MTASTVLLVVIGYFQYRITSLQNSAQVSIFYDGPNKRFLIKNFGNLKARDIRVLCQHIEVKPDLIAEIHPKLLRTRFEPIYAQEEVVFAPENLSPSYKSPNPQFLICTWKFKKTLFDEFCERVFLKMPNTDEWLTANQTLTHPKQ